MRLSNLINRTLRKIVVVACAVGLTAAAQSSETVTPLGKSTPSGNVQTQPRAYSPGVGDVVKMLDAKVDPQVVKAYINNSGVAYRLTAEEIVALKERGVPDDVVTTMLQRGGEIRANAPQLAGPANSPEQQTSNAPYAPAYPNAYPDQWDDSYNYTPYYVYSPYSWPISPYSYWWYDYGWPFTFYTSFYFGGYWGHHHWGGHYPYYCGYPWYRHHYGNFPYRSGFTAWRTPRQQVTRGPWAPYRGTSPRLNTSRQPFGTFAATGLRGRTVTTRGQANLQAFGAGVRNSSPTSPAFGVGVRNPTAGMNGGVRTTAPMVRSNPAFGAGVRNTPGFGAGVRNTSPGFGTGVRTAPIPSTSMGSRGVTHGSGFSPGAFSRSPSGFSGSRNFTSGGFSGSRGGFSGGGGFSGRSSGSSGFSGGASGGGGRGFSGGLGGGHGGGRR